MHRNLKRSRESNLDHSLNDDRHCTTRRRRISPDVSVPLYDSNNVPIKQLLGSIVQPDAPLLFFPEYALRRIRAEHAKLSLSLELRRLYSHLLNLMNGDKHQLKGMSFADVSTDFLDSNQNEDIYILNQLALTIVIPSSPSITGKVAKMIQDVVWENSSSETTATVPEAHTASKPSNIYKRSSSLPGSLHRSQTLTSLVDGVIFTLVQRRVKESRVQPGKPRYTRGNRQKIHKKPDTNRSQGRNILCDGYEYCKGHQSNNTGTSHCSNMAPGIQCRTPNSCTTFSRSSPVMQFMHKLLGDDLLRELLMNTIILIPLFDSTPTQAEKCCLHADHTIGHNHEYVPTSDDKRSARNYFQLCGRPLFLGKAKINSHMLETRPKVSKHSRKRGALDVIPTSSPSSSTLYQWNPHEEMPRSEIFYSDSFSPKVGFPSRHILNSANKDDINGCTRTASNTLLESMVQISASPTKRGKKRRMDYVRIQGERICQEILKNHTKCDYARLLERYCPLPSNSLQKLPETSISCPQNQTVQAPISLLQENPTDSDVEYQHLLSSSCSLASAASFIKAVIVRVFPLEFWGSKANLNTFMDTLTQFLALRRGETLTMKVILHGIQIMHMTWLYRSIDHEKSGSKRRKIRSVMHEAVSFSARNVFKWLYCTLIIPLLRNTFYITDTQVNSGITFYRKPVWFKIRSWGLKSLRDSQQYLLLSYKEGLRRLSASTFGASKLRLLPKTSNLRPIVNLAKPYRLPCMTNNPMTTKKKVLSVNTILRTSFDVLNYELSLKPNSFGSGIQYDHIHSKYMKFMMRVRESSADSRELFFASIDIQRCFDNINQDMMYKIVREFITEDEYIIQKYFVLYQSGLEKTVRSKTNVENSFNLVPFHQLVTDRINANHTNAIIVDGVNCRAAKRQDILELLHEHLFQNMVVTQDNSGVRFMQQKVGIAQGSILSTFLCNLYYGYHEMKLLDGVIDSPNPSSHVNCIVRVVDDFMFISTDIEAVCRFLTKAHSGLPSLGINVNMEKSRCNFDFQCDSLSVPKAVSNNLDGKNEYFFSWCGLLFNTCTGAVHVDYERFSGGRAVDSIVMGNNGCEGLCLMSKMRGFVRPRALPLLYDLRINTIHDIQINYCQAVLLCAIKMHAYISRMDGGYEQNPAFVLSVIEETLDYFYHTIRLRLKGSLDDKDSNDFDSPVVLLIERFNPLTAKWLGLYMFALTLTKQLNREHTMVQRILSRYRSLNIRNEHVLQLIASEAMGIFNLIYS